MAHRSHTFSWIRSSFYGSIFFSVQFFYRHIMLISVSIWKILSNYTISLESIIKSLDTIWIANTAWIFIYRFSLENAMKKPVLLIKSLIEVSFFNCFWYYGWFDSFEYILTCFFWQFAVSHFCGAQFNLTLFLYVF